MIVLFAEEVVSQGVSQGAAAGWVGLGVAVVAMVGGLAKAFWDKDNAVKLVKLEAKVESQGEKLAACEERHKKGEDKIEALERLHGPGRCVPIDPDATGEHMALVENQQPVTLPRKAS